MEHQPILFMYISTLTTIVLPLFACHWIGEFAPETAKTNKWPLQQCLSSGDYLHHNGFWWSPPTSIAWAVNPGNIKQNCLSRRQGFAASESLYHGGAALALMLLHPPETMTQWELYLNPFSSTWE
ncbi:hypothetical protein NPIL_158371 [Nephila pilipes]|uniref:Uncharacterized protein n=1 Tax=Nephila pilipes TaxID=299642 RepID=A0A8X6UKA4_NEPPI|nr:hypothetical protein NPIL_158371 [Nephila pilipes]